MPAAVFNFLGNTKERTDTKELAQDDVIYKRRTNCDNNNSFISISLLIPFSLYLSGTRLPSQSAACSTAAQPSQHPLRSWQLSFLFFQFLLHSCSVTATSIRKDKECTRSKDENCKQVRMISRHNLEIRIICPEPISSLTIPMHVRPTVNPSPIPIPSKTDGRTGFFEAYALCTSEDDTVYNDQRNIYTK